LTESAPPARPRVRQPSKKSKGTSDVPKGKFLGEVMPRRARYSAKGKMRSRAFGESPIIALLQLG
jgi:hypothetical protein